MKEKSITNVIIKKGKEEAKQIRSEATARAKAIESEIINEAKIEATKLINNAKVEADGALKAESLSHNLAARQALLIAKSEMMDELFMKAYQKIKSLPEKEYLKFIIQLLEKETYQGSEEIKTNKVNHQLFERLLPEINKHLKTTFKLSKTFVDIDSGFLIVGKYYDLNFDFLEIIQQVRKQHETKLAEELFNK